MTQYNLFSGEQLRDAGIEQVISHNSDYKTRFEDAADRILIEQGSVTSEEVVQRVGMPDGHPSAVGGAMRNWAKRKRLKLRGYRRSSRPSCHSAVIGVWA